MVLAFVGIILAVMIPTYFLAQSFRASNQAKSEARLIEDSRFVEDAIVGKSDQVSTAMNSLRAFFAGSETVTRKEFYDYLNISGFRSGIPADSTISYIENISKADAEEAIQEIRVDTSVVSEGYPEVRFYPESDEEELWPIIFVDPEAPFRSLIGYDQNAEASRRGNIQKAIDSGVSSITPPILLSPGNVPGFVIVYPLYEGGITPSSVQERRAHFIGAVTIALRIDSFFPFILKQYQELFDRGLQMRFVDSGRPVDGEIFSVSMNQGKRDPLRWLYTSPKYTIREDFANREGIFYFTGAPGYRLTFEEKFAPILIHLAGGLIAIVFCLLFYTLVKRGELDRARKENALLRSQYEFITVLSHQLRTPINAIKWGLESLDKKPDENMQKELRIKAESMNQLVDTLLYFLEIGEEYRLKKTEKISLLKACREIMKSIDAGMKLKKIKARATCPDKRDVIWGDARALMFAFHAIMHNAVVYNKEGGTIRAKLKREGENMRITFQDTGFGIPKGEQKKLFSKFFRAKNASLGKNEGSGVSLFLTKKIIEGHGGDIRVESEEGKGTTVVVTLPIKPLVMKDKRKKTL